MNRADRAKQFMPFDALKGLKEELKKREERRLLVEKKEISEEETERISANLLKAEKGDGVKITFYRKGRYVCEEGILTEKNFAHKFIAVNGVRVFFDDINDFCISDSFG